MQVHYHVQNSPKTCHAQQYQRLNTYRAFLLSVLQARQFGRSYVILSGLLSDTISQSSYDSQSADREGRSRIAGCCTVQVA